MLGSRRSLTLFLLLLLALVSVLLNVVTNDLTNGSADSVPAFRALREWSLPALAVLVALLLAGQALLFLLERPARRRWNARRPPYPGLEPFTEEDAGVFFGREAETAELVERLSPALGQAAHRFVAVVGPSGSGKSSLVQAGLLPALAAQRRRWLLVPPFVPEDRPTANLARALAAAAPGRAADPGRLAGGGAGLAAWLDELRLARGTRLAPVLLVVDQAEELVSTTPAAERDAFLRLLRGALAEDRRLWVVATLRSEFLDDLLTAGFADLFRQPVLVGPPGRSALFEIIERPAAQAGVRFAPGLVSRMVDETGGGDALPMLAYTLDALYRRAGPGGLVTERMYRELGGVEGALADQADRIAAALRAGAGRDAVMPTLLRFVALEESGPALRRAPRSALDPTERRVVDAFVAARLMTSDVEGGDAVVRVVHEALYRRWPPLRQAVEAAEEMLRRRAKLERWAQDWVRSGRRDSYLLTGERLELAEEEAAELGLPAAVAEFLEHSRRLDRAAMERLAEAVAMRALGNLDRDPELAALLALAAVEECAVTPASWEALLDVAVSAGLRVVRGHADGVWTVAWSPDGGRLLTGAEDRTARVWDAWHGRQLAVLQGHHEGLLDVAWSPDGRRVATVARDRTLRLWAAADGAPLLTVPHETRLRALAWSPDGSTIACAGEDGTVSLRDAGDGGLLGVLRGHDNWVRALAWSPDGSLLATGSDDRAVRVWDPAAGAVRQVVRGHAGGIRSVAWAADGRLATASVDGTARVWGPQRGEVVVLRGHEDVVRRVAWEPGGRRLATASEDRTVRLWDPWRGTCLMVLRGHESAVRGVDWLPAGRLLATASEDRTFRLWEVDRGAELAVMRGHEGTVHAAAWSPEGRRLATASRDRTLRVWDAESGAELLAVAGHEGNIRAVAWAPDGRRLASASLDRTARVWDVESGEPVLALRGHEDAVRAVGWSPDGRRLVTASEDRTARIWDAGSGDELLVVRGHLDMVRAAAWSPDGSRIATASRDGSAAVWEAGTGRRIAELCGHEGSLRGVVWAPEGRRVATGADDGTVRVWDAESGEQLAVLTGHRDGVRCVGWSADGALLASGSRDGTVRTFDVERAAPVAIVGVHGEPLEDVAWSPDGRRLASASRDRTARVWDAAAGLDRPRATVRARVARPLTPEERRDAMLP
jgi:WD40 repeat protein